MFGCCCQNQVVKTMDVSLNRYGWTYHPLARTFTGNQPPGWTFPWPPAWSETRYMRYRVEARVVVNGVMQGWTQELQWLGDQVVQTIPATGATGGSPGYAALNLDGSFAYPNQIQTQWTYQSTRGALGLPPVTDEGDDGPVEVPGWQDFPVQVVVLVPLGAVQTFVTPLEAQLPFVESWSDAYYGGSYSRAASGSIRYFLYEPESWGDWRARFDAFADIGWEALETPELWPTASGLYRMHLREVVTLTPNPDGRLGPIATRVNSLSLSQVFGAHPGCDIPSEEVRNDCGDYIRLLTQRGPASAQNYISWTGRAECRTRMPLNGPQWLRFFDIGVGTPYRRNGFDVLINPAGEYTIKIEGATLDVTWPNDGTTSRFWVLELDAARLSGGGACVIPNVMASMCQINVAGELIAGPRRQPNHLFWYSYDVYARIPAYADDAGQLLPTRYYVNEHGRVEFNRGASICAPFCEIPPEPGT
jgi:hypothetical protein